MIPVFNRHLDVTWTCGAGEITFTIANPEEKTAAPVTVKRSDGTEHGVAELPAGGVLVERIDGTEGWVSVWATFPTRQWHARVSGSCPASTSTTQPAATTTVPVAPTRMTVPVTDVFTTVPAELPLTGMGDGAEVAAVLVVPCLAIGGLLWWIGRRR